MLLNRFPYNSGHLLVAPRAHKARLDEYFTSEGVNFFIGRNALYITDRAEERPPTAIKNGFQRVEMIALFELTRRGLPLRELRVFAGTTAQNPAQALEEDYRAEIDAGLGAGGLVCLRAAGPGAAGRAGLAT